MSDFLQSKIHSFHLDGPINHVKKEIELSKLAEDPDQQTSSAALWLCLLLRLNAMTTDPRLEVRHGEYGIVKFIRITNNTQGLFTLPFVYSMLVVTN